MGSLDYIIYYWGNSDGSPRVMSLSTEEYNIDYYVGQLKSLGFEIYEIRKNIAVNIPIPTTCRELLEDILASTIDVAINTDRVEPSVIYDRCDA